MPRPLRIAATIHYGKSPNEVLNEDGEVPVIGTGGTYGSAVRQLFSGPAIVVPRKGSLGNPQYVNGPFWPVDTTFAVIPNINFDARWLYYHLDHFDLTRLNEATGVPSISRDWLYRVPVGNEDYPEQQRIVEILSTVDEAIEQTEALIAKTQQIKAGLMHDLFTRGVTPDGQLRPPREEAPLLYKESPLGWIPKEWALRSCSEICLAVIDCKNRTPPIAIDGHPVIRTPNVRDGEFVWADLVYTDHTSYLQWTARGRPAPGDIVITREAPVGEVCMIPGDVPAACLGQRMMLYRPNPEEVLGNFLVDTLQSQRVQKYLDIISGGSTVGHVRVGDIRGLRVPWTGLGEQAAIAEKLDSIGDNLQALRKEEAKLRSLKSGLMSDLLTGRVPVAAATAEAQEGAEANV